MWVPCTHTITSIDIRYVSVIVYCTIAYHNKKLLTTRNTKFSIEPLFCVDIQSIPRKVLFPVPLLFLMQHLSTNRYRPVIDNLRVPTVKQITAGIYCSSYAISHINFSYNMWHTKLCRHNMHILIYIIDIFIKSFTCTFSDNVKWFEASCSPYVYFLTLIDYVTETFC